MPFLSNRQYTFLFFLLGIAYLPGLFVPLMDNDSAHHANIALHMHLTGDYLSLVDNEKPYLDKPHLLFWLSAFAYKLFGVTTFAYKLPSLLFTILGTYSTYKLGKLLYNEQTGKLAALILASSFAYILANNDVRMDAILTASIAFALWQLVVFIQDHKLSSAIGSALGLALAFSTKGLIGVIIPAAGAFFYIWFLNYWKYLVSWKWLVLISSFAVFISPVLYAYYVQFNLHPELVVRGHNKINGVKFILWDQSFERFDGESFGTYGRRDRLFFFHTFLWAFCPWCIIAYIALFKRIKEFASRKQEWLTTSVFIVTMLGISLSGFKLPHYLNILFPVASIIVASYLFSIADKPNWLRSIFTIQTGASVFLLLFATVLNAWAFPITNAWLVYITISLALLLFLFIYKRFALLQQSVLLPIAAMIVCFFTLNANFYTQLLKYQGGNELAFQFNKKERTDPVYIWGSVNANSWLFYTATQPTFFKDSLYTPDKKAWLLFDQKDKEKIIAEGYELKETRSVPDYGITKLKLSFINPATRDRVCSRLVLAEVVNKKIRRESMAAIQNHTR